MSGVGGSVGGLMTENGVKTTDKRSGSKSEVSVGGDVFIKWGQH